MNLYSASHFRMADSPELKKMLSQANRYLVWKCILLFKEKGYKFYDMGGLSYDDNIRRFKLGFGGKVVPVYWGYEANSIMGSLVLRMRNWKMALATAREIQ
jgi:lipid II:glycine glycyltransferase (peptidoglycan interpeptide bridge formation enzyme)